MEDERRHEIEFLQEAIKIIGQRVLEARDEKEKQELQKALGYMQTVLDNLEHIK